MPDSAIYSQLETILVELFELEPSAIAPHSKLDEDLGLDSIDAVDLTIRLKELTGKKLEAAAYKKIETVQDVVDAIAELLN
jgi:acyl carrier protein